jgi:hypothetical protein
MQGNKARSTSLSSSKKKGKFRKLFCISSSSNGNKEKVYNQYRLDYGEAIPKLALSSETDYQSDNEGKLLGSESFSENIDMDKDCVQELSRKFNLENSLEENNPSMEQKTSVTFESLDSLEEFMASNPSSDVDENKEHRQKDLIKFLSEMISMKSPRLDDCNKDAVNVLNELVDFENSVSWIDHHSKDTVNVLNELISLENSRYVNIEDGKLGTKKTDPNYHRSIVARTLQEKGENVTFMNTFSREKKHRYSDTEQYSSAKGYENDAISENRKEASNEHSNSYDEEATVVTIKCSNRSKTVESDMNSSSNHDRTLTSPQMDETTKEGNEKTASCTSSADVKFRKKKFNQAVRIYEETLNMNVTDFKDIETFHSMMTVTATKLAKLYIATGQNDVAIKYIELSKQHRMHLQKSSASNSSSESSPSSSSSS